MLRLAGLLLLSSCGRVGFDSTGADAPAPVDGVSTFDGPAGHDEDGDGVPDVVDPCPHIAGVTDGDGDGVGDACDPNPDVPGDTILRFATMGPDDQPFTVAGGDLSAVVTQEADALRFDGDLGVDGGLYGSLVLPIALGNVRVALGIDVIARVPGSASGQHQIALIVADQAPNHFVEVNDIENTLDQAAVVRYDGSAYDPMDARDLAMGIHPGPFFLQATQRVGEGVRLDAAWPGEPYVAEVRDTLYQGATRIELSLNNLHLALKYLVIIASP